MQKASTGRNIIAIAAISLAATSCAEQKPDPATETPVEMKTGLYAISISGGGAMKVAGKNALNEVCVWESERQNFPHKLAKGAYAVHPQCINRKEPREGNKIAGSFSCPPDPKMAAGNMKFIYTGAIAEDTVTVEIKAAFDETVIKEDTMSEAEIKHLKLGMKALKHMTTIVEAKHVGRCP